MLGGGFAAAHEGVDVDEFLGAEGKFEHKAAVAVEEDRDAAVEAGRGGGAGLDEGGGGAGGEAEMAFFKAVEGGLVFEDDNLGEGLAAELEAEGELNDPGVADELSLFEDFTFAEGAADHDCGLADGREDRVTVCVAEQGFEARIVPLAADEGGFDLLVEGLEKVVLLFQAVNGFGGEGFDLLQNVGVSSHQ